MKKTIGSTYSTLTMMSSSSSSSSNSHSRIRQRQISSFIKSSSSSSSSSSSPASHIFKLKRKLNNNNNNNMLPPLYCHHSNIHSYYRNNHNNEKRGRIRKWNMNMNMNMNMNINMNMNMNHLLRRKPNVIQLQFSSTSTSATATTSATSTIITDNIVNHQEIEKKWQQNWLEWDTFRTPTRRRGKRKKYVLDMFPYPSGNGLHVGHPEGYTASDIMVRYWKMNDFDVLHPMGWDAFGLPAEQHAINTGLHPQMTTLQNIDTFRKQLMKLGFAYDWSREISTTDDNYMKWTQWIFLKFFEKDLAYQSEMPINWCPMLGTGLSNEEVIDGKSERGSHPVIRKSIRQWALKITAYADELENGLMELQGDDGEKLWPEGTLSMQRQWIGKSCGAKIVFDFDLDLDLDDNLKREEDEEEEQQQQQIQVFTTRPDTLMGVTYVVLAPEHSLVEQLIQDERTTLELREKIIQYCENASHKSDLERQFSSSSSTSSSSSKENGNGNGNGKGKGEKTGVFTGRYVYHPLTNEKLPLWIADYVIGSYGTGAVMAVPAHDQRDYDFAKQFNLPIKVVIKESKNENKNENKNEEEGIAYTGEGIAINSGDFNGYHTEKCKKAIITALQKMKKGDEEINYKLRDWNFSRQRYWGEPIPIYFPVEMDDPIHGDPRKDDPHKILYDQPIPVPENELPIKLPDMDNFHPGDDPSGCLARAKDWRYFTKKDNDNDNDKNKKWYARETNTMPQWAGSCWYYLRFIDPHNSKEPWSKQADKDWMPVDLYVGGAEHAVLHLLYARFWHKLLYNIGMVKDREPFQNLVHQGIILGTDGEKMSKSRGNVINPDHIIEQYGADSLRLYEMFMGPLEATKPWQTSQVSGVVRFRAKVFRLVMNHIDDESTTTTTTTMDPVTEKLMHKTVKKVTEDIEAMSFNTAISTLMIFTNHLTSLEKGKVPQEAIEKLILLLSPFAPHISEECWEKLQLQRLKKENKNSDIKMEKNKSILSIDWPTYNEDLCMDDTITIAVQVNGKTRGTLDISNNIGAEEAKALATEIPNVNKFCDGKEIKKVIYVPGKIVNIVVTK